MKKAKKRIIYTSLAMVCLLSFLVFAYFLGTKQSNTKPISVETETPQSIVETQPEKEVAEKEVPKPPSALTLVVPYTTQAPFGNWNIHEESCEEAAILMVNYYLSGNRQPIIAKDVANKQLIEMVNWQKQHYGKEWDLNLTELGKLAKDYYNYSFTVKKNINAEDIKQAISQGRPVMVPVITHGLQNPHYGRTPTYHILVIKGYDAKGVITNDAGVSEGRNYHYTWRILWQAIDAQTAKMKQGRDMLTLSSN